MYEEKYCNSSPITQELHCIMAGILKKNVATAAMRLRIYPEKGCVNANNSTQRISIYKMRNTQTAKTKLYSYVQTQPDVTYRPK